MGFALGYVYVLHSMKFLTLGVTLCVFAFAGKLSPPSFMSLKQLDFDHDFCDGHADLGVGADTFVEIENPLRGTGEYNALIQKYQAKDYAGLEEGIGFFRKVHESSPLIEAVTFLEVQSKLDQLALGDDEGLKELEAKIRQTFLLYPKSTLTPIITTNLANYFLANGNYNRALSLYQLARNDYPFHRLSCVFLYGAAEANYLIRERGAAKRAFELVLQKCDNARFQVGAQARLLDLRRDEGEPVAKLETEYSKLYEKTGVPLSRFSPATLFNLAEMRYRRQQYPSSRFFLKEFLRYGARETACIPTAYKRLADIAMRSKDESLTDAIGKYFLVKDKFPKSEIGTFSQLHAYLLDFQKQPPAEQERRLRLVEAQIESITDRKLQTAIFLEKGLALLEIGQKNALEYLVRMNERTELNLQKGELAAFVREHLLKILEDEVKSVDTKTDSRRDRRVFEPLETAYITWLKGSPFEARARQLYREMVLQRFDEALAQKNPASAVGKLKRWEESELSPGQRVDQPSRVHVGSKIAKLFVDSLGEDQKPLSKLLQENEETLTAFFAPEFQGLWVAAALNTGDKERLEKALSKSKGRSISSVDKQLDKEVRSYLFLAYGQGYREVGKKKEAEESLKSVDSGPMALLAEKERMKLYQEGHENKKIVDLGVGLVKKLPAAEKKTYVQMMKEAVLDGKLWKNGANVLQAAVASEIEQKELASYYFLAGRSQYELGDCNSAIGTFNRAFTLNPDIPEKAEAKFRMGKCYFRLRDKERARKAWQEVEAMKDPFWTPLSANELRLVAD